MSLHDLEVNVLPLKLWLVRGSTSSDAQNGSPQKCKAQFASDPLNGLAVRRVVLVS